MGFYIGVNGCSMKTEQNLETLKTIRLDRLLLETGKARILLDRAETDHRRCSMVLHDKHTRLEKAFRCLASLAALPLFSCDGSARVICPWKSSQGPERAIIDRRSCMGSVQVERHHTIREGNRNNVQEYCTALLSR